MEKFNMNKLTIKKMADTRTRYEFTETNKKNERLIVEIIDCYYPNAENGLPSLWKKHGYTNKLYENAIHVDCFCYTEDGQCFEKYNPTIKLSDDKNRYVINFDWLLEVTEENKNKILKEIYKRFMK